MLHVRWCKVPEFLLSSVFLWAECSLFPYSLQQLGFVSCVYISDSFPVFLITLLHLLHQNLSGIAAKFTSLSFRRKAWSYWGDGKHQTTSWSSGDDFLIIHYGGPKRTINHSGVTKSDCQQSKFNTWSLVSCGLNLDIIALGGWNSGSTNLQGRTRVMSSPQPTVGIFYGSTKSPHNAAWLAAASWERPVAVQEGLQLLGWRAIGSLWQGHAHNIPLNHAEHWEPSTSLSLELTQFFASHLKFGK